MLWESALGLKGSIDEVNCLSTQSMQEMDISQRKENGIFISGISIFEFHAQWIQFSLPLVLGANRNKCKFQNVDQLFFFPKSCNSQQSICWRVKMRNHITRPAQFFKTKNYMFCTAMSFICALKTRVCFLTSFPSLYHIITQLINISGTEYARIWRMSLLYEDVIYALSLWLGSVFPKHKPQPFTCRLV